MASPTITGTAANQSVKGTGNIRPFANVAFADSDGDLLHIQVERDARDFTAGTFTDASVAASGFIFTSGIEVWTFDGTAAQATAAIRLLEFDPSEPVDENGLIRLTILAFDGPGAPDTVDTTTSVIWSAAPNSPPAITSNGGTNSGTVQVSENKTFVTTVTSTDPDGDGLDYALIGGVDQAKFTISSASGDLRFIAPPDFENPTDQNGDNIYEVIVGVTDGNGGNDKQRLFVNVNDQLGVVINGGTSPDVVDATHTVEGQEKPTREDDTIHGNGRGDSLSGLDGADVITGDAGDDTVTGGAGLDFLDGGAGKGDTADYSDKTNSVVVKLNGAEAVRVDLVIVGAGGPEAVAEDLIKNFENVIGSSAKDLLGGDELNNVLKGNDAADALFGFGGDDTLVGGAGKDKLKGGDGNDTADYTDKSNKVIVDLGSVNPDGEVLARIGREVDTLTSIENIAGGRVNDKLTGNDFTNILRGNDGNDVLYGLPNTQPGSDFDQLFGGRGDDLLYAGEGLAKLSGNEGADTFIFEYFSQALHLTDFSHKDDTIQLSRAVFGEMGQNADGTGALKAKFFHIADSIDQFGEGINYSTQGITGGQLYYWKGSIAPPVLFANVGDITLAANDFLIS